MKITSDHSVITPPYGTHSHHRPAKIQKNWAYINHIVYIIHRTMIRTSRLLQYPTTWHRILATTYYLSTSKSDITARGRWLLVVFIERSIDVRHVIIITEPVVVVETLISSVILFQ